MRQFLRMASLIALAVFLLPHTASADSVTAVGTGSGPNSGLSATAVFTTLSGGQLQVTLTNSATSSALNPSMILTGVFFTLSGVTLTPVSATIGSGSTILFATSNCATGSPCNSSVTNMGGEWGYGSGLGFPLGATMGISSTGSVSGLGAANFNGPNLWQPNNGALDGLQGGIAPLAGTVGGNAAVTGNNALISDTIVFVLSGLPSGYTLSGNISNINFQYGTSLSEPNIPCTNGCTPVPEPGTLALFGTGLLSLAGVIRRRIAG